MMEKTLSSATCVWRWRNITSSTTTTTVPYRRFGSSGDVFSLPGQRGSTRARGIPVFRPGGHLRLGECLVGPSIELVMLGVYDADSRALFGGGGQAN